jgi:uncharacterized protein YfdQ (DUF2303 family)
MFDVKSEAALSQLINLADLARGSFGIDGIPAVFVPPGCQVQTFEQYTDAPRRIGQVVTLNTPESFIEYYNRFSGDYSAIFCDLEKGHFNAVMDYHVSNDDPSWCGHQARYQCPVTPEWSAWRNSSGVWMDQETFAAFIESNQEEIIAPIGAEMLELASSLQAKVKVQFSRAVRLDNGQVQLEYKESIDGSAGVAGQIKIPEKIRIGVQLFQGGAGFEIEARFRYRVREGVLHMAFELIRPHKAHEAAMNKTIEQIASAMEGGALYLGEMS